MKRPSPVFFMIRSEQERAEFLKAGIDLPRGKAMEGGEFIRFEIADDDPRLENFARIIRERTRKDETLSGETQVSRDGGAELRSSSQSIEELLSLEGKSRANSLVLAFEQAISQKAKELTMKGLPTPSVLFSRLKRWNGKSTTADTTSFSPTRRGNLLPRLWSLSRV